MQKAYPFEVVRGPAVILVHPEFEAQMRRELIDIAVRRAAALVAFGWDDQPSAVLKWWRQFHPPRQHLRLIQLEWATLRK